MNVSIIPFKSVESIKDEWIKLSKNQTIFQSYEWNANYLKIKWGGWRNYICIVKDDNEDGLQFYLLPHSRELLRQT